MQNFCDFESWGFIVIISILLVSLLVANILKRRVGLLRKSLIPTSVLGGVILLIITLVYEQIVGRPFFSEPFFGTNAYASLELITYHMLALGFIAVTFKSTQSNSSAKRNTEIFNTGVTTVSTYLLQGVLGLAISLVVALVVPGFFKAAGVLLPFGYGQGTGQALNYGNIYEMDWGFVGGKSFGLAVAALGFISAAIGGVIHLNILKKKIVLPSDDGSEVKVLLSEEIQSSNEIPMNGSIDKLTFQFVLIFFVYMLSYLLMRWLGTIMPNLQHLMYGFNFLFGVLVTTLFKFCNNFLLRKKVITRQYVSSFLMTRISGFCFDMMIVAGIAAIRFDVLKNYWLILIIMGVSGAVLTYFYNRFVARTLFPDYCEEQFLAMYGMLTGTASTGVILLRELDPEFATPASENLVYQNLPAIVFGFPIMLLAAFAPKEPELTLLILVGFCIIMNLILFRSFIFKKKAGNKK